MNILIKLRILSYRFISIYIDSFILFFQNNQSKSVFLRRMTQVSSPQNDSAVGESRSRAAARPDLASLRLD